MTTPFSSASFPSNPTVPHQAPAGYTTPTTPPNPDAITPPVSASQMDSMRGNLLEMVLREVVQALVGAFVPGAESAFDQLAAWAENLPVIGQVITPIVEALTGIIDGDLDALTNWANGIPSDVVDHVALDPGKFFAEAMNVTGITALWVNTIQPFLTNELGNLPFIPVVENFIDGILRVTQNPTGSSAGSLVHQTATMVGSTATDVAAQASSATHNAVTTALSSGHPAASSPVADAISALTSSNDPDWNLPVPKPIAQTISNITGGMIQFWGSPDTHWLHLFIEFPPPDPPAGIPASWHENLTGTPPPPPPPSTGTPTGAATDGSNIPIPVWLADFLSKITGGYLSFWMASDGSWIHGDEPVGGEAWQNAHVGGSVPNPVTAAVTTTAANLLDHPAVAAVTKAVSNAASGASPSAKSSSPVASAALSAAKTVSTLTSSGDANWPLPIPKQIAETISNLTRGMIQFWGDPGDTHWLKIFLEVNPPDPPVGVPASWHENLSGTPATPPPSTTPSTGTGAATDGSDIPIPTWLADLLHTISGGYLSFWMATDGSWIHGDEPVGGDAWQNGHVAGTGTAGAVAKAVSGAAAATVPVVKNIASNVAAMAAPAVKAVADKADAAAPAKGISGEVGSVVENLLALISNPTGSGIGSIVTAAAGVLASGVLSSPDVLNNITSALTSALTDAAKGLPWNVDISSRFGDSDLATLLTGIVGIFANPAGSSDGGIAPSLWQMVWQFINCNGLTGKGFTAGNNITGVLDNPTGSSSGTSVAALVGYVTDLAKTLFSNGGAGLKQLIDLGHALITGNVCALLADFFNGTFATVGEVEYDINGILGFFTQPILPSPTALVSGAQTAASAAAGAAAGALGLGSSSGGLAAAATNVVTDFMGTLGNPSGLGTGNVTLNPLDNIPILGPILDALFSGLGGSGTPSHTGLLGLLDAIPLIGPLIEQLPALLAGVLGPGANNTSVLPDANFSKSWGIDIQGQGQWTWAWPGKDGGAWGGPGCVRTVRNGLITVYFVPGTWEILPGITSLLGFQSGGANSGDPLTFLKALASPTGIQEIAPGDNILDWSRFELIAVPYGGATYPMGETEAEGVAALQAMINAIPGKFVLIGHSQGGCVISDVYDSLRTGSMQDRNDDLIMGVGIGNMRRQKGTSIPNLPAYCPDGEGCFKPLQTTEERWWEWAIAAGTYPGKGELDGVTYPEGDPVSCLGDDGTSNKVRQIIATTMAAKNINIINMFEEVFELLVTPGGKELMNGLSGTAPHNTSMFEVQPFLAQGDTRTFWEYMLDSINALSSGPLPPPERRQLESTPIPVAPGAVVTAGAYAEWMNVNATGPAIMVGLNCYDANNRMISTPSSFRDAGGNLIVSLVSHSTTVYNPVSDSDGWQHLVDQFVIPAGTVNAKLVFNVEPDAMDTGVVFFDDAEFVITSGTIDAGQLGNIGGIPSVPPQNVGGIQNVENNLLSMQNTLDGLASAFSGDSVTDVAFSEVFSAASKISSATRQALDALPQIHSRLIALESAAGIPSPPIYQGPEETEYKSPGTYTYPIPGWMNDGDGIAAAALGAGAGGKLQLGGTPGSWAGKLLIKGTDFPSDATELTVIVGAPGGAVSVFPFAFPGDFSATGDGDPSTVSATGMTTLSAAGGIAGGGTSASGLGPGSFSIPGSPLAKTYFGGPTVAAGSPGAAPGGGGAGATTMPDSHAEPGADGYVSLTAYQVT